MNSDYVRVLIGSHVNVGGTVSYKTLIPSIRDNLTHGQVIFRSSPFKSRKLKAVDADKTLASDRSGMINIFSMIATN